jgi:elongation factor P
MVTAIQLKVGNVIVLDGNLYRVISLKHVVQQQRRGFISAKLKGVTNGVSLERRFRSSDRVELAILDTREAEYLYSTGHAYVFMDTETYEQISLDEEVLGSAMNYVTTNERVKIQYHDRNPVGVEIPIFVDLEIVETEPPLKGATATASPKTAKLETGLVVRVPQFLQVGEKVRIDTRDDSFVERVET